MRYGTVLLDVGGTLIGPSRSFGAVYAEAAAALGLEIDADLVEARIWEVWNEMDRAVPTGANRYAHFPGGEEEYWLRFARQTLERASERRLEDPFAARAVERIRDAFLDPAAFRVYEDVRPTLERLREQGARLAVVSNWDSRLPQVLAALDLARYFDVVGVSCFEGVEKPHPRIFRSVLERLGARPSSALHVGDVPEIDLTGARAAGIAGLLVDRRGRFDPASRALRDLSTLPDFARGEREIP
jgi:putative hydrolase of the HAD superfamily